MLTFWTKDWHVSNSPDHFFRVLYDVYLNVPHGRFIFVISLSFVPNNCKDTSRHEDYRHESTRWSICQQWLFSLALLPFCTRTETTGNHFDIVPMADNFFVPFKDGCTTSSFESNFICLNRFQEAKEKGILGVVLVWQRSAFYTTKGERTPGGLS